MDLAKHERAEAAAIYSGAEVTARDRQMIANVLRTTKPGIDRQLALGANCPYAAYQKAKRAAWVAEINRQEEG